jgi:hypothetical protein
MMEHVERVRVAREPMHGFVEAVLRGAELHETAERCRRGIPVELATRRAFGDFARRYGAALPATLDTP